MSTTTIPAFARRNCDGLAQIGLNRFDVTGIRFFDGEGASAPGGPGGNGLALGASSVASGPASTAIGAGTTPAPGAAPAKPPWGDDPSKFDPDKAWKLIENLRTEAETRQTKTDQAIADAAAKAQKDTLAQFAKLLSGEKEPETDPVKLAATIAEKDTALATAQTAALDAQRIAQAAILGGPLGANITALLADPAFKTSLASVDPTKEADVKSAITQALQANAALKQPPRSSGDLAPTGPTVQSLEALLAKAMKDGDTSASIILKRRIADAKAKS